MLAHQPDGWIIKCWIQEKYDWETKGMNSIVTKCADDWHRRKRERWLRGLHSLNHNHEFSLISNDHISGVNNHDSGEQFRSPTGNL